MGFFSRVIAGAKALLQPFADKHKGATHMFNEYGVQVSDGAVSAYCGCYAAIVTPGEGREVPGLEGYAWQFDELKSARAGAEKGGLKDGSLTPAVKIEMLRQVSEVRPGMKFAKLNTEYLSRLVAYAKRCGFEEIDLHIGANPEREVVLTSTNPDTGDRFEGVIMPMEQPYEFDGDEFGA